MRPAPAAATAGRGGAAPPGGPRRHAATTRAAGRFSGIVHRFSTTTRSAPASAASTSAAGRRRRARRARGRGRRWSTGPSPRRCAPSSPSSPSTPRPRRGHHRDAVVTPEAERHEGDGRHGGTLPTPRRARRRRRGGSSRRRGATTPPAGSACRTRRPTRGSGCGTAASTPSSGPTSATSAPCASSRSALAAQDDDGFVPHLRYGDGPRPHAGALGPADAVDRSPSRRCTATPRRVLTRRGHRRSTDDAPRRGAGAGLRFLLAAPAPHRGGPRGAVPPVGVGLRRQPAVGRRRRRRPGRPSAWFDAQGRAGRRPSSAAPGGAPLHNPAFAVGSVGFSALVAWNARELAEVTDDDDLRRQADELAAAVDARWDADLGTWVDDGPTASGSGRVRTLDALLPLLVCDPPGGVRPRSPIRRPSARRAGPAASTWPSRPTTPTTYWRGPAWPQLTYLLWLAHEVGVRPHGGRLPVEVDAGGRVGVGVRGVLGGRHRPGPGRGAPDLVGPDPAWWRHAGVGRRVDVRPRGARRRRLSSRTASAAPKAMMRSPKDTTWCEQRDREHVAEHAERVGGRSRGAGAR